MKILIADDSLVTQMTMRHILHAAGHEVTVVADGREALRAMGNRPVDLLVSDISMPGMDGLTLLRTMRASAALCAVPVILITGSAEQIAAARAANATALLTKPVSSRQVVERVAEVAFSQ